MNLEGILAISGKPGLYKLVTQSRSGFIVQSLIDNKKIPISAANNVSALQDIAIYTYSEEIPLVDIFRSIAKKEDCKKAISHKESADKLKSYFGEILPDFDEERVYNSDIKKVISWYNQLVDLGMIDLEEDKEEEKSEEAETPEAEEK